MTVAWEQGLDRVTPGIGVEWPPADRLLNRMVNDQGHSGMPYWGDAWWRDLRRSLWEATKTNMAFATYLTIMGRYPSETERQQFFDLMKVS